MQSRYISVIKNFFTKSQLEAYAVVLLAWVSNCNTDVNAVI